MSSVYLKDLYAGSSGEAPANGLRPDQPVFIAKQDQHGNFGLLYQVPALIAAEPEMA